MNILRLEDFELKGYNQCTPLLEKSAETGDDLLGVTDWIPAKVPGSVYSSLLNAGIIENPMIEMNSLKCEWVPERWWGYKTKFHFSATQGKHYRLKMEGIDYKAHIWFNQTKLGISNNMHVPFEMCIDEIVKNENELNVLLENAPFEYGQIGYTSKTHTQKSRFNYKWDWCVRMKGIGIDAPVYIEEFGSSAIETINTEQIFQADGACILDIDTEIYCFNAATQNVRYTLLLEDKIISYQDSSVSFDAGTNYAKALLRIDKPALWWPNNHGEQPLYQLMIETFEENNKISDKRTVTIGIRSVKHAKCEKAPDKSLPYLIKINGKSIYIKGVNLIPMEMQRGDVTNERIRQVLENICESNCNLIRIWGGGYIGNDFLYEMCDKLGIMVWQEFIQSSSGLDNVPSKDKFFLEQLADTAKEAVKRIRNHPSLVIFSGGNELTDHNGIPITYKDQNINLLKNIVNKYSNRLMLPSSASGPNEFLDINTPGSNHDVHGPWKYQGTSEHYNVYNCSDSQLHSEFGVDGATNLSSLTKTLSKEHLHVTDMKSDIVWRHRGEWWDTYLRETEIFGPFDSKDLETFIMCSQYIQAEGLRYALEANRRRAFQNCGSIIWQYNEPFPGVSGTNLEDYYGEKKLAYYYVKNAYRQCNPNIRYSKLLWNAGEECKFEVFITNELNKTDGKLNIQVTDWQNNLLLDTCYDVTALENTSVYVKEIWITMPESEAAVITLSLKTKLFIVTSRYVLFVKNQQGFADKKVVASEYLLATSES